MGPASWIRLVTLFACAAFPFPARADDGRWVEVRTPHFRIVTDEGDAAAQTVALQAERVRSLLATVFPHLRNDPSGEVVILALTENATLWQARLGDQAGHVRLGDGLYQGGEYRQYIGIRQSPAGRSTETLAHEYFHLMAAFNFRAIPLWLNEGLADSFADAVLARPVGAPAPRLARMGLLKRSSWIPLSELLFADKQSPRYVDEKSALLFYSESWAVTHYLLSADGGRHAESLWQLLRRLDRGVPYSVALQEALGDIAPLELQVKEYLEATPEAFLPPTQPQPGQSTSDVYPTRQLTPGQAAAVRGDFFLHVGNLAAAENALGESLRGEPHLAAAAESMGLLYLRKQRLEVAAEWFARAVAQDSAGPLAHYYHAEFLAAAASDSTGLEKAEAHLRRTLELDNNFARAHAALGGIQLLRGELDQALHSAGRAASLEPRELSYQLDLARILARRGDLQGATNTAQQTLENSLTERERAHAQNLFQYLEQYQQAQSEVKRVDRELAERAARRSQPSQPPPASEKQSTQKTTGPAPAQAYAWGTISKVACSAAGELQLTLDSSDGPLTLRARNYANVPYYDAAVTNAKRFDPCRHLTGAFAGIVFRPARGSVRPGEILAIELHSKPTVSSR